MTHTRVRSIAITLACAVFLLPLGFLAVGSLRLPGLPPPAGFEWVPRPLSWSNYRTVFLFVPLWTYMKNSLVVVAVAVPVTVLVASWAGFAIVTASARTRKVLVVVSLAALMVPATALWVPRFVMLRGLGLTDSLVSLMTPALMGTTPFYVLLFALAYSRLPRTFFEAAALEGLSPLGTWRRVVWPLTRPVTFAVAILAFIFHWSNFVDPLLFISSREHFTLPLGLRQLHSLDPTNFPILLAASVIATIPAVIAFVVVQRAFFAKTLEV